MFIAMERHEHTEITTKNPYVNTLFLKFIFHLFSRNITFLNCLSTIKSWLIYNICFCKAVVFTLGLVFSYKLAEKVIVSVFITYLTEYYDLRKAAAYANLEEGLSKLLVFFLIYISKVFSDHFVMIIFCLIVTYTSGMVIFALTVSDVFPMSLFDLLSITGLILVAVGRAGLIPFIRGFAVDQLITHEPDLQDIDVERVIAREETWWRVAWGVSSLVAIPLFNTSWTLRFRISASVMAMAFIVFVLGKRFYHKRESSSAATPFTTIRVIKSALLNWHIQYPSPPDRFFTEDENNTSETTELWPQVKWLRWLDKAAVIESTLEQNQQIREGRLFSVTEVQETKYILKMVPMWCAFPMFGLVLSAGNTFFAEQAMDLEFPGHLIYLILLQSISRETVSSLSTLLLSIWYLDEAKQKQNMVRIWAGMLVSILCCTVASRVEAHRLHVVAENELLDYPFKTIPMSIWWLAPQFCLLGLMDGLATGGLEDFTNDEDHLSLPMKNFLTAINGFVVTGIGSALNIIFIYQNTKYFGSTLNLSRLDLYYQSFAYYVPTLNCAYLLMISITIYRCSAVAQVNSSQSQIIVADVA
ncbi:hypothetical protein Ddye_026600 [Dipteronia dyeriana]|uniref:Uncharacterized protein n=1 Tax=Dipteronia dyeriana TaxID=168575 RepID=A0AAD9WQP5_9ROSI|nr:hypothetical protein Ddye_026600 [Dipteronia dyeriana]